LNPAQAPPPSSPGTRSKAPDGVASADEPWAASAPAGEADDAEKRKKQLKEQTEAIKTQLSQFQTDVRFGTGKLWRIKVVPEKPGDRQSEEIARNGRWVFFIWEFLGSLLTGILVSIGAPYWHDLLQALSALRSPKAVK